MEGTEFPFKISLEDALSAPSKLAATNLHKLQNELGEAKNKLGEYQRQLQHAKDSGDIEQYRKFSKLVGEAKEEVYQLGNSLETMGGSAAEAAGELGPLGIAALAATAVITGLGVALYELGKEGVETALEVNEVNEQLTATFDALGSGPQSGKKTLDMLNELAGKLPQSRDQLAKWTKQYEAMGMTDLSQIRAQLVATAGAQAIMGDEGASAYESITEKVNLAVEAHHGLKLAEKTLKQLYSAGINVTDVADRLGMSTKELTAKLKAGTVDAEAFGNAMRDTMLEKGKKPLEAMSNSLGAIKTKAKEAFDHLFDGIDVSPITNAFQSIVGLGDQGQATGKELHKGITFAIQGIINWLGKMLVEGEVIFLQLELWAIQHRKGLKDFAKVVGSIGDAIIGVTHGIEWLLAHPPPAWLVRVLAAGATGGMSLLAEGAVRAGQAAKGNASGGLVGRPAPGEFMASVAPGEFILPRAQTRQLMGGGFGVQAQARFGGGGFGMHAGGGGRAPHVERLHVEIHAPHGVTDATSLTATGLALALEKHQLMVGR